MSAPYDSFIKAYLKVCNEHSVLQLLVGGGAVNYYGYKRHSADLDFWIDIRPQNVNNLLAALAKLGFEIDSIPPEVISGRQNLSIKASPDLTLELITRFDPNKTFDEAYKSAQVAKYAQDELIVYKILDYQDLIMSKVKSGRPKDLLDIYELKRIRGEND